MFGDLECTNAPIGIAIKSKRKIAVLKMIIEIIASNMLL
jgi:hypothetical protein